MLCDDVAFKGGGGGRREETRRVSAGTHGRHRSCGPGGGRSVEEKQPRGGAAALLALSEAADSKFASSGCIKNLLSIKENFFLFSVIYRSYVSDT